MAAPHFNPRFHTPARSGHFPLGELELDAELAKKKGLRYSLWPIVAPGWFANPSVTRPHMEFIREPKKTFKTLSRLAKNPTPQNIRRINQIYEKRTRGCVGMLRKVFQSPRAQVIFESSGTAAVSLIRNMVSAEGGKIVGTTDMGRIVRRALQGTDVLQSKANFRQPIGLFSPPEKLGGTGPASEFIRVGLYGADDKPKSNNQLYKDIIATIRNNKPKLVVVPHVSRTGRILPVERIGEFIRRMNKEKGTNIAYVVDGIQAMGRVGAKELNDPLKYCDAYLLTGHKALGSMISSAIVARPEFIRTNAKNLISSPVSTRLCHYQFSNPPREITQFLNQRGNQYAISLPEVHSLELSLRRYYTTGKGKTFSQRREHQLKRIRQLNKSLINGLKRIEGIKVLESSDKAPYIPSIVSFSLTEKAGIRAPELKRRLQSLPEPITLASLYEKPVLRIGLSELREQDIPNLIKSIGDVLNSK